MVYAIDSDEAQARIVEIKDQIHGKIDGGCKNQHMAPIPAPRFGHGVAGEQGAGQDERYKRQIDCQGRMSFERNQRVVVISIIEFTEPRTSEVTAAEL